MEHQYAETNGIRIHYVTAGQGSALFLLHGHPQFWYMWRKVIPSLSQHYRIIAPDTRGFGQSDKPKGAYSRRALARDVVGLIDALGIEKAYVAGHDWGGIIAHKVAIDFPHRVAKLILVDSPLTIWPPLRGPHGLWYKTQGLAEQFLATDSNGFIRQYLVGLPDGFPWGARQSGPRGEQPVKPRQEIFPDVDLRVYQEAFRDPHTHHAAISLYRNALPFYRVIPDPKAPHDERFQRLTLKQVDNWYRGGISQHTWANEPLDYAPGDRHKKYHGPTMWIYSAIGRGEPGTPFEKQFYEVFPNLRVEPMDDCGHFIPEEQPERTVELFLDFLGK